VRRRPIALPAWCGIREYHLRADGTFRRDALLESWIGGVAEALGMPVEDFVRYIGHAVAKMLGDSRPWLRDYLSGWRRHLCAEGGSEVYRSLYSLTVLPADDRAWREFRRMATMFATEPVRRLTDGQTDGPQLAANIAVMWSATASEREGVRLSLGDREVPPRDVEKPAEARAMALLREYLDMEQREQLLLDESFIVVAASGRIYRISPHTCAVVSPKDRRTPVENLCVHWENWADEYALPEGEADIPPVGDMMLRCKLLIEADEEAFRRDANVTITDPDQASAMAKLPSLMRGVPGVTKKDAIRGIGHGLGDLFRNVIDARKWGEAGLEQMQAAKNRRDTCRTTSPV
jgi:hypothetical protein